MHAEMGKNQGDMMAKVLHLKKRRIGFKYYCLGGISHLKICGTSLVFFFLCKTWIISVLFSLQDCCKKKGV